ncbi:MAG: hypothetical protein N0C90_25620, partial [Candidatus Thiodiazotropha endolucinida]|nr:hypothetical protein [Candidatus Thiodiazotropha taylori]MCW4264728.1 hypothetical protein [Candidatus Thiodiazotropha endolucinida]
HNFSNEHNLTAIFCTNLKEKAEKKRDHNLSIQLAVVYTFLDYLPLTAIVFKMNPNLKGLKTQLLRLLMSL